MFLLNYKLQHVPLVSLVFVKHISLIYLLSRDQQTPYAYFCLFFLCVTNVPACQLPTLTDSSSCHPPILTFHIFTSTNWLFYMNIFFMCIQRWTERKKLAFIVTKNYIFNSLYVGAFLEKCTGICHRTDPFLPFCSFAIYYLGTLMWIIYLVNGYYLGMFLKLFKP